MGKAVMLEEMTYVEVKKYFEDGGDIVIIPTGSTEQHGQHMVLGTDSHIAREFARRISERTGILVAPTVNYGYTEYHKETYPGTIGFDHDVLYDIYYGIATQFIKLGAKRIIFMNGHGGNSYPLKRVSMNLRLNHDVMGLILDWWNIAGQIKPEWEELGHAGKPETAAMMYLFPEYVHQDRIKFDGFKTLAPGVETKGSATFGYGGVNYQIWLNTCDVNGPAGNYGEDPKLATLDMGRACVDSVIDHIVDFIENGFKKMQITKFKTAK